MSAQPQLKSIELLKDAYSASRRGWNELELRRFKAEADKLLKISPHDTNLNSLYLVLAVMEGNPEKVRETFQITSQRVEFSAEGAYWKNAVQSLMNIGLYDFCWEVVDRNLSLVAQSKAYASNLFKAAATTFRFDRMETYLNFMADEEREEAKAILETTLDLKAFAEERKIPPQVLTKHAQAMIDAIRKHRSMIQEIAVKVVGPSTDPEGGTYYQVLFTPQIEPDAVVDVLADFSDTVSRDESADIEPGLVIFDIRDVKADDAIVE